MATLNFEDFSSNLYVLSMIGDESKVKTLKNQLDFNDLNVFYGLNFKNAFYSVNPYSNPLVPPETKTYIAFKPGSVACLMNHYYAIQDAHKNGLEFAVFIEDDISLIRPLHELKEAILELPEDFDCLNFGWIKSIVVKERQIMPTNYSETLYNGKGMDQSGAFGYLLSKNGIKNAINLLKDNFMVSDLMFKYLNTYYTKEPFLEHPPAYVESRIR